MHIGVKPLQFFEVSICPKHEHTTIPKIVALIQIGLCSLEVWLLNELLNLKPIRHCGTGFDIPVTCFRCQWQNAKCHHCTLLR